MRRHPTFLWPLVVGALSLGITAWVYRHEQQLQERRLRDAFDFGLRQTITRIEQRVASYEQMLRGVRGLFEAAAPVTRDGFSRYVDALLAGSDNAGLRNIVYAPWIGASDVVPQVATRRAAGKTGYVVAPPGVSAAFAPITFAAPDTVRSASAMGYDPYADPVLRVAMDRARDSGGVALSDRELPPRSPTERAEPGFLMIMPSFNGPLADGGIGLRRARLSGWVLASFRIDDLMSSLYGETTPGLDVRLYDGILTSAATQIYPPVAAVAGVTTARLEAQEYIGLAGHTWTVEVRSRPEFERIYSDSSARIIAVAGIGLSASLVALTWLLVTRQQRAYAVARSMTRQLREGAERYRRIVETADEGIWMIDGQGRTSFVNPKMQLLLGYDAQELDGRPWTDFMADQAVAQELLRPGAQSVSRELCLLRRDGGKLWATLTTNLVTDEGGRAAGLLAMVTDITERRQSEARRAVLENQLRQSQKMEAIGTLAGGIAHDFNNVLAAILGHVALLQQAGGASEQERQGRLAQVSSAASRARGLVQQIVAFSRQQPQELSVQPLHPLIEETATLLRVTLPPDIELRLVLGDEPICANADSTQVQQVVMNLCTNAWHAMAGNAGLIEVGLDSVVLDEEEATAAGGLLAGQHARVWVGDDGVGMDAVTRLRIFEPFFTTKPLGQGTGLGLSVAHGIMAAHRGAITVTSAPGRGSRFELLFPLARLAAHTQLASTDERLATAGHGEEVLYVDDDDAMVVMVEGLLQKLGYHATVVADAVEARRRLRDPTMLCDVLVTDYNMPTLSGLDLAREAAQWRPHLPVLITSGFVTEELRSAALDAGARHVLQKEYMLERLAPLLRQMLDISHAAT